MIQGLRRKTATTPRKERTIMFPDLDSTLQAVFRWFHVIAGITW